jgi:DNA-binding transcriptional regulator YbjK
MSRRTDVADAAITTLAREGMRGLTHRAVDRTAGLPEGSTSCYFRTRRALLRVTVQRLAELDAGEIPALPTGDLDALAHATGELLERWLTTGRERQLARYELCLEATRRSELRETLVAAGAGIRALVCTQLATANVGEPERRAGDLVAFLDGLLFDQIAGAGTRRYTPTELRAAVYALLTAVVDQYR